jgi:hypothetical protein
MNGEVPRYWLSSVPALMPENSVLIRTSFGPIAIRGKSSNASCRTAVSTNALSPTQSSPSGTLKGAADLKRLKSSLAEVAREIERAI